MNRQYDIFSDKPPVGVAIILKPYFGLTFCGRGSGKSLWRWSHPRSLWCI